MAVASHIWSGQHVRIRSQKTGKYVAIEPDTLSNIDRLSYLNLTKMIEAGEEYGNKRYQSDTTIIVSASKLYESPN